jgi:hypothetical protein
VILGLGLSDSWGIWVTLWVWGSLQSSPVQIKGSQNLGSSKRVLVNKAKNIIHDSEQNHQMTPHGKWNFNPHEMS